MELPPITVPMVATLAVGAFALVLFVWNRLPFEVVGLLVMAALMVLGVLTPTQAVSGFSNDATVTVAGMLFLSAGLEQTGAVDELARWIARIGRGSERRLLFALMAVSIPASAFLNNTAIVAVLLPVVLGICRRHGFAPSRFLMPLSFAAQLGGTLTLVGTSTNLLAAGLLTEFGFRSLGLFEITPPAIIVMLVGVVYLVTLGRVLLPTRLPSEGEDQSTPFHRFDSALIVGPDSPLIGCPARRAKLSERFALELTGVRRGHEAPPLADMEVLLQADDVLLVIGSGDALKKADGVDGMRIARPGNDDRKEVDATRLVLMEAVVPARSRLVGRRARSVGPLTWFGAVAIAVQCYGRCTDRPLERMKLSAGDLLLVEGTRGALRRMQRAGLLLLVGRIDELASAGPASKRWLSGAILLAVVVAAAVDFLPILMAVVLGVVLMVVTGCLKPAEAYDQMDWSVLILLGSLIPFGLAMQRTGAAKLLAALVLGATSGFGPHVVLASLYLLTTVLTEFISNNASAVVLTPVAVSIATAMGVSPYPFVVAVMFAASNSFLTPIGYQTNTFIFAPGRYHFTDFARVGAPLALILVPVAVLVIPMFFPF